ncbi:hypothetical protein J6590_044009 [Homalodisca vitripennis]|nr:hypothetical protein J6590_044009 [Homalodisca vitripennis]
MFPRLGLVSRAETLVGSRCLHYFCQKSMALPPVRCITYVTFTLNVSSQIKQRPYFWRTSNRAIVKTEVCECDVNELEARHGPDTSGRQPDLHLTNIGYCQQSVHRALALDRYVFKPGSGNLIVF